MADDRYDDRSEARYEETDTDRWSEDVLEARWGADLQPWDEPERHCERALVVLAHPRSWSSPCLSDS